MWFPKFVPKLWETHTQADFSPTDLHVNRNHGSWEEWGGGGAEEEEHGKCYRDVEISCNTI